MRKHRNQATYKVKKSEQETPSKDKITIQGDSLTVAEMLRRLSQGVPITGARGAQYEEGEEDEIHDMPDWEELGRLDIIEQQEAVERASEIIDSVKNLEQKKPVKERPEKAKKETEKEVDDDNEKL